jgi:prepilin signal peptidase PulO-like enzyme (type II secretory pathway)
MALAGLALGILLNMYSDHFAVRNRKALARWAVVSLLLAGIGLRLQAVCGWQVTCLLRLASCGTLVVIAAVDLEERRVPNDLIVVGVVLAAAYSLAGSKFPLTRAVIGGAVGLASFALIAGIRPGAMGAGDIKLAGVIGMMTGFPGVLQALVVGILAGGASAAVLMLTGLRTRKQYIPYAPYLVIGGLATVLFQDAIAVWFARAVGAGG